MKLKETGLFWWLFNHDIQHLGETIHKFCLSRVELLFCFFRCKPARSVYLSKLLLLAGFWRPLHSERIAFDRCDVQISLERPSVNNLAALVFDSAKFFIITIWRSRTKLFRKFTLSRNQHVLAVLKFTFWDRPGALVFFCPKRPSRMNNKHLKKGICFPV